MLQTVIVVSCDLKHIWRWTSHLEDAAMPRVESTPKFCACQTYELMCCGYHLLFSSHYLLYCLRGITLCWTNDPQLFGGTKRSAPLLWYNPSSTPVPRHIALVLWLNALEGKWKRVNDVKCFSKRVKNVKSKCMTMHTKIDPTAFTYCVRSYACTQTIYSKLIPLAIVILKTLLVVSIRVWSKS